jgi:hypothetical protein
MEIYESKFQNELRNRFQLRGWEVLKGAHHSLLDPNDDCVRVKRMYIPDFYVGPGIVDLRGMMKAGPDVARVYLSFFYNLDDEAPRATLFSIDPARPPEATIKDLRPYLAKLHKPYRDKRKLDNLFLTRTMKWTSNTESTTTLATILLPMDRLLIDMNRPGQHAPYQTYKNSPIKGYAGIKRWLDYFKCYDLRRCEALSFGEIAKRVYGQRDAKTYERAEQGFKRARTLIRAAEANNWPPPPIR